MFKLSNANTVVGNVATLCLTIIAEKLQKKLKISFTPVKQIIYWEVRYELY